MPSDTESALRSKAREMLAKGEVALVLGWGPELGGEGARPLLASRPEEAERLVWNEHCVHNLATYLTREPCIGLMLKGSRVGVVAKGCDARAIAVLIQEKQIKREGLYVIGVVCDHVLVREGGDLRVPPKCHACEWHVPLVHDHLVGDKNTFKHREGDAVEEVKRLLALPAAERWDVWRAELSRCIKCYACREACPMCYCRECITEQSRPQWIDKASHLRGNIAYHTVRAMHLAGRCIDCGECRRACPMGIRVDLLPRFLSARVEAAFGYRPGLKPGEKPFFVDFKDSDPEDFIR